MTETREIRLKRLRLRSMRRGIREMDLILQAYAAAHLDGMDDARLDTYEALLEVSDPELYAWIAGRETPPDRFAELVKDASQILNKQV